MDTTQEGFIDLDELLADSVSLVEDTKALKKGKEKLSGGWITSTEREQLHKEVAQIEQRREWASVARTHLFHSQRCSHCGSVNTHYAGAFLHQRHLTMKVDRWAKIEDEVSAHSLPLLEKVDESLVDMCIECHRLQEVVS